MNSITSYTDYRKYLKDYIVEKKKSGFISNRSFAQKAGVNSSSWLTSILQGKKGLSKITANKISNALKHSRTETLYFENLVFFNQAKTREERNRYYQEIASVRKAFKTDIVEVDQFEYYAVWYHSVIRSMIGLIEFQDDFKLLAHSLSPAITEADAKKSVQLLERLKLIEKKENGFFRLSSLAINATESVQTLAITNYQQETMRLAWEAIDRFPKEARDINTLTLGISEKGVRAIKAEIAEFRNKVSRIAIDDEPADRVYQLNIQYFPMSIPIVQKGGKK